MPASHQKTEGPHLTDCDFPVKYYVPALLWASVILLGSAWPGADFPDQWQGILSWDKALHGLAYFTLAVLAGWGARKAPPNIRWGLGVTLIAVILYGILIEVLQFAFFTGRRFEIFDILANSAGALIGHLVIHFFTK